MTVAFPFAFVAALMIVPASEKPPVFDVRPGCQAATDLMTLNPERAKRCIDDEMSARDEVAKQWSSFPHGDRQRCSAEAQLDGAPSYVDLLECLTLARESKLGEQN